jgi:hypothetical protein
MQLTDIPNNYSPHLWLEDLDDVLTMNTTGQSDYQYFGTNIGSRYSGTGVRYGYANVSSSTKELGLSLSSWSSWLDLNNK